MLTHPLTMAKVLIGCLATFDRALADAATGHGVLVAPDSPGT